MKIVNKDIRFKLSIKIILTLFLVFIAVLMAVSIIFNILQPRNIRPPEDEQEIGMWLRIVFFVMALTVGISIVGLFSLVINKTVVARIRKLENAAKEVAKGNFEVNVPVKGRDELSSLTDSFNKMSAELKANEYLSKEFIRNISHEFKTPLSSIRAYGELLETAIDNCSIDEKIVKEYSNIIIKESDRLASLSKSILQLSLLDSTTIIKKDDIFKPSEQIKEILRVMHASWNKKNLAIDLELDEAEIINNEQLLYQVWQNLLSNAIKFSKENGRISIILKNHEDVIICKIIDNGIGISEFEKEKIYDHFYMSDKSRNSEGSGLGLAIVKRILVKIGGEIELESVINEGSIFTIIIKK